jgi:hypothetical protein
MLAGRLIFWDRRNYSALILRRLRRSQVFGSVRSEDCCRSKQWKELSPDKGHGECPGNDDEIALEAQPDLK